MTIKKEFKSELESLHKSLIEVNDWMYENPELAFEEFETSKYLVNYIKKYDPEVMYPTHGLDTAFEVTLVKMVLSLYFVSNTMHCQRLDMPVATT